MFAKKVLAPTLDELDSLAVMDPTEFAAKQKLLVRKIDLRLMPMLILMIVMKYVPMPFPIFT